MLLIIAMQDRYVFWVLGVFLCQFARHLKPEYFKPSQIYVQNEIIQEMSIWWINERMNGWMNIDQ